MRLIVTRQKPLLNTVLWLNPDNSNLQGKSKRFKLSGVRVFDGKISKKLTWREIKKVRVNWIQL